MKASLFLHITVISFVALTHLGGCSDDSSPPDAGADLRGPGVDAGADGRVSDGHVSDGRVSDGRADTGAPPYSHSLQIDGVNDFTSAAEAFETTTTNFTAYITWDATHLYIGYQGVDIASGDPNRWIMAYFDSDPSAQAGAAEGEQYGGQKPDFTSLTSFRPDAYFRWKMDNTFQDLRRYQGAGAWSSDATVVPDTFQQGDYFETRIAWSALGDPSQLGITTFLLNEMSGGEWWWAGLYSDNFTDGFAAQLGVSRYLLIDRRSDKNPNDPANGKP